MDNKRKLAIIPLVLFVIFLLTIFIFRTNTPKNFPTGTLYTLESGTSLSALATDLSSKSIIRSPFLFKAFSVIFGGSKGIRAGDYFLALPENVISMARRFSSADYHLSLVRITIPEGLNTSEIGLLLHNKFPKIDQRSFIEEAQASEGYLFPDTYLFLPNTEVRTVIDEMSDTFKDRILELKTEIEKFDKPLGDIIKMASIVEEEGRTTETRRIIAGILWKRISLNMPLQVDASFKYINGKTTKDLTLEDLRIESPYNSYLYKGLPPTPICNPGLDSILATVTPIKTDYLYFLTDKKGEMHYAKTYDGHLQNKQLYLE
jgi:UPF0755 protein